MPSSDQPSSHLLAQFLKKVRGAVPLTIEQIDIMLRLAGAARPSVERFLDLGCGDGVLIAAILEEHREARGVFVDASSAAVAAARHRLDGFENRVEFVVADIAKPGWVERVSGWSPFDAVVSGFAIHHLGDERKRAVYAEILPLLQPDGIFLNIEHVASATRWTESVWDDYMIDAIFGTLIKESPGKTRAEIAREYYLKARKADESYAPLEVQLDWLREIGFENVECYLKVLELAVFGGQRPTTA
jgi:tRNA (cmo5U34)-methyltransferase